MFPYLTEKEVISKVLTFIKSPVLLTGADGQLGSELQNMLGGHCVPTDVKDLDITDPAAVDSFFNQHSFSAVINCAAYTAVDKAESDSETAEKVNVLGAGNLANASRRAGIPFIHISTDFVFDGKKSSPYTEADEPAPLGVYGATKLRGEKAVLSANPDSLIIRTSWVYSAYGKNFVKTMLHYGKERGHLRVVADQTGTPTWAKELALVILHILPDYSKGKGQLFNYSQEGAATWYDFAAAIMEAGNIACTVEPIETIEYPTPAVRPAYSVMNKKKIRETFGFSIPHWRDSLRECMKEL